MKELCKYEEELWENEKNSLYMGCGVVKRRLTREGGYPKGIADSN